MVVTLDSTDALKCAADIAALDGKSLSKKSKTDTPEGEVKKEAKAQRAAAAAAWSKCLSEVTKAVGVNKGLLILTSQVRTNPGVMFGSPFYRSCGAALDYFSEIRVWMWPSTKEKVDDVEVGGWTKIEVTRNKVTGAPRTIYAPIYPAYGIDDTRAMLHFLADTGSGAEWANKTGMAKITVGGQTMTLAEMAAYFEGEDTKGVLKKMVTDAWAAREAMLKQKVLAGRKPRFA
jgi:RecA/RadA recombinase